MDLIVAVKPCRIYFWKELYKKQDIITDVRAHI